MGESAIAVAQASRGAGEERESSPNPGGLVASTIRRIIAFIRGNDLKAGAALPSEAELSLTFGVSRAVVREALRSLSALTLIDVGAGRRARVAIPDASVLALVVDHAVYTEHVSIQQIFDVRRALELRTAALAAMRRSEREAGEISRLAAAMRADFDEPERVKRHDLAFHALIGAASRNPMFSLIVQSFQEVTRKTWGVAWISRRTDAERLESVAAHEAIAAAIATQDPRAAEAAMAVHFDASVKALLSAGVT
jgi:DNA-binding FadR family transcriptional regulator